MIKINFEALFHMGMSKVSGKSDLEGKIAGMLQARSQIVNKTQVVVFNTSQRNSIYNIQTLPTLVMMFHWPSYLSKDSNLLIVSYYRNYTWTVFIDMSSILSHNHGKHLFVVY